MKTCGECKHFHGNGDNSECTAKTPLWAVESIDTMRGMFLRADKDAMKCECYERKFDGRAE